MTSTKLPRNVTLLPRVEGLLRPQHLEILMKMCRFDYFSYSFLSGKILKTKNYGKQ